MSRHQSHGRRVVTMGERLCPHCGQHFKPRPVAAGRPSQRCCSKLCARRDRLVPLPERFDANVVRSDGCWLWTAGHTGNGYGAITCDGRQWAASQAAWFLATGVWPGPDDVIAHTCDTPSCVRNDDQGTYEIAGVLYSRWGHLVLTTTAGNAQDSIAKHRQKRTEALSCICGARLILRGVGGAVRARWHVTWQAQHIGPGHAPTTVAKAARVRRTLDAIAARMEA